MPSFRLPRALTLAASEDAPPSTADSPAPAKRASDGDASEPSQLASAAVEESESRSLAGGANGQATPAEGEELDWHDRFDSVEELWAAFLNVDRLRGRLANEVGLLRKQGRLLATAIRLANSTPDPLEQTALLEGAALALRIRDFEAFEQMVTLGEQIHRERLAAARGERAQPKEVNVHV
jgi:hypothetical protein